MLFPLLTKTILLFAIGCVVGYIFQSVDVTENKMQDLIARLDERVRNCSSGIVNNACVKKVAHDFLDRFTVKEVLDATGKLDIPKIGQPLFSLACHQFTHYVGEMRYAELQNLSSVYQECLAVCGSGCFHGATEGYIAANKQSADLYNDSFALRARIPEICGRMDSHPSDYEYSQCIHGLGHGFMFVTENRLPLALDFCDEIPLGTNREPCYDGVFMENTTGFLSNSLHPTVYARADDLLYPCYELPQEYHAACYSSRPFYVSGLPGMTLQDLAVFCTIVPSEYRNRCYYRYGVTQAISALPAYFLKRSCDLIPDKGYRNECIKGIAQALGMRDERESARLSFEFCSFVEEENKESCYRQAGAILSYSVRGEEALHSMCAGAGEQIHREWCVLGASDT